MAMFAQLQGLIGIAVILLMAWGFSEQRRAFPGWRWVGGALLLQILIALVIVRVLSLIHI
jgi:CNT family concentrative nucleoside transporter